MPDPLAWLMDCIDVPIECSNCHMITTLGGYLPDYAFKEQEPTVEEMMGDLCDCDVPFRVYVGDAPKEHVEKLSYLLDVMEILGMGSQNDEGVLSSSEDVDATRQAWADQAQDDQRDD